MPSQIDATLITSKLHIRPEAKFEFADWQARLNERIAEFPGFLSLEIISPREVEACWVIVQRFYSNEELSAWRISKERSQLMDQLKTLLEDKSEAFQEAESSSSNIKGGITEVFVTQVSPDKEKAYREWIAKIHRAEAKFTGFRGVYVQAPTQGKSRHWITLLQFDTPENLDRWLTSPERLEVLESSKELIESIESHRVISPYAGWFSSLSEGASASVWKQTMLVLLVLFPIVMFELKFLSPLIAPLNMSVGTFIGNAISVTLIAWPMMPVAIWFLGWWLLPEAEKNTRLTLIGTFLVIGLYLIEILLFWTLL